MNKKSDHSFQKVDKKDTEPVFDFESAFDPNNYLYFYEKSISPEVTKKQIDFLVKHLQLTKKMRILDVACGHGRHAIQLAEQGHSVVGVDSSKDFINIARSEAHRRGVSVRYVIGDMRHISYQREFDRVILLYTSFGYFSDDDNFKVLKNVAAALKSGGLFCLDILNRDALLKNLLPYVVTKKEENLMISCPSFDARTGRLRNDRIIIRNGLRKDFSFSIRVYNFTEIKNLLGLAGLDVHEVYGSWDEHPFTSESERMIIIAKKENYI